MLLPAAYKQGEGSRQTEWGTAVWAGRQAGREGGKVGGRIAAVRATGTLVVPQHREPHPSFALASLLDAAFLRSVRLSLCVNHHHPPAPSPAATSC